MSGEDTKVNGERRLNGQLPSPSLTPEPEYVASSAAHRPEHRNGNAGEASEGTGFQIDQSLNGDTHKSVRRRSITNDDAILSDSSERTRPPPIKRPGDVRRKSSVSDQDKMLKLSPKQIHDLTSEPRSIPLRAASPILEHVLEEDTKEGTYTQETKGLGVLGPPFEGKVSSRPNGVSRKNTSLKSPTKQEPGLVVVKAPPGEPRVGRPGLSSRAVSTPVIRRKQSSQRAPGYGYEGDAEKRQSKHVPPPLNLDSREIGSGSAQKPSARDREKSREREASPGPASMPLPPFSVATFLSLELAPDKPSPLYIYRPPTAEFPYESAKLKYERIVNFWSLPAKLEAILGFGALACLDAWLHVLTILPLRFMIALSILVRWWGAFLLKELRDIWSYVYYGLGRLWRRRTSPESQPPTPIPSTPAEELPPPQSRRPSFSASQHSSLSRSKPENVTAVPTLSNTAARYKRGSTRYRHRRTKSTPSTLFPTHKADILKGLLVIFSSAILMRLDASKMYHAIRAQSGIKLYVIYNVLEVIDRLLSAVGQDCLECLISRETLDRDSNGRSLILRPLWMFGLALVYNVLHATALFYQVITLNVAVNSYSNALLTLLLSNQFVEIKGTVFKKFEKENLFQITCADIVERFQLWLMLLIIAMRNIVEVGGLSFGITVPFSWRSGFVSSNSTAPFTASSILPLRFAIFPKWIGQVFNPFFLVLGSETFVDWLKHGYITKFNQYKPDIYGKFFDVLAKDYYSTAFTDPNLTRRLGLPVLPLACLFIRAAVQTYHMFIATNMPPPLPSRATSLTESTTSSPTTTATLARIDQLFRRALGRSSFGDGVSSHPSWKKWLTWDTNDFVAVSTMALVFFFGFLLLLVFKLVLGMVLLSIARNRYRDMKERERAPTETGGKYIGGFGLIDVDEEKRRWIYNDDPDGLARLRERDEKARRKEEKERAEGVGFGHVSRYSMASKRIW